MAGSSKQHFGIIFAVALWFMSPFAWSQQVTNITQEDMALVAPNTATQNNPVQKITNNNHIPILNNRFRIDHEVDSVTMVFFRELGSAPVVLVQPNGSKLYQYMNNTNGIIWFDAANYDMVTITNPMRGPWQAVGQILPESKVMVLSDLELVTEPIANELYVGETMRMRAQLLNDGKLMTFAPFSEAVRMTIEFRSANLPEEPNFGARPRVVANFVDDGIGMDEVPKDSIFTGEFSLDIPQGVWNAYAEVDTPMYKRSVKTPDIRVYPNPISVSVKKTDLLPGEGEHEVYFKLDYTKFDVASIMLDGVIRYPNGEAKPFVVNEPSLKPRVLTIPNVSDGVYAISGTLFVKTLTGRDVQIALPRTNFVVDPPPIVESGPSPEELALLAQQNAEEAARLQKIKEEKMVKLAIWINLMVFLVGGTTMFAVKWWLRRKETKLENMVDDIVLDTELEIDTPVPWYTKLLEKLPFKKASVAEEAIDA